MIRIDQRQIGNIVVLGIEGNITEHEDADKLRAYVSGALAAGLRKFILNIENVAYINSTGLGEIVRTLMAVHTAGGIVSMCHPTKRLLDLFAITKLLTTFTLYTSVAEGLRGLSNLRLHVTCPHCGPACWIPVAAEAEYHSCPACGIEFKVRSLIQQVSQATPAPVTEFRLPTYEGEFVHVAPGAPSVVTIDGRLELFTSEALERAVALLPSPRHVLYRLRTREVSSSGLAAVEHMCIPSADTSRGAISIAGLDSAARKQHAARLHSAVIFETDELAAGSFGKDCHATSVTVMQRWSD